jgi:predicted nucleic acid-binding protein
VTVGYLLDTCLLSEVWKASPNDGVIDWLRESTEDDLFMSVLSLGEIRKGIEKLSAGKKKQRLLRDYGALRSRFSSRILAVTDLVAERWGELSANASRAGRHVHVVDGLLAATALVLGHTVVTRNVADFESASAPFLNPWT